MCLVGSTPTPSATLIFKDKYLYKFPISCTDGSKGNLELGLTIPPPSGIGIGRMSDGSKIKVIIGDLAGTIGW